MRFFSSSSHRSGPFPAAICAALFGDDDAFALPFPDERALELGKGHDREHQIGHRGILAGEGEALFQELDPDAASGKRLHQPTQIIEVAGEAIHAVHDYRVAFADEGQHGFELGGV